MANLTVACIAGKEAFSSLSGYESQVEKARATLAESTTECREKLEPLKAIMPEVHGMLNGRTEDLIRAFAESPSSEKFANLRTFLPGQTETKPPEDPEDPENSQEEPEKEPTPLAIRAKTKAKIVWNLANGKFNRYLQTIKHFLHLYERYTTSRKYVRIRQRSLESVIASANYNRMMQMEALAGLASSVWEGEPVVPPGTDTLELSKKRSAPTYATEETAEDLPFLPCIDTNRLAKNSLSAILWPYFKEFTAKATA